MEYLVQTPCGPVRGVQGRAAGTVAYKGIRYATAGRWEYPRQVTAWEGIYDAGSYGPCSYQPRAFYDEEHSDKKFFYYREFRKGMEFTYSEDCLMLNVFTPAPTDPAQKLPVLVYIHGGGFTGGCAHEKHFDGPVWPQKGVIGVTIQYRLGPMGFVCLPELAQEAGITGNYGLFDQLTALQWIRDNIAAFGGDPENVTIMGQSAGAMSVQQLCLSPLSRGLFHKAVMSSGGGVNAMLPCNPAQKQYPFWQKVMQLAGCESLEQFRAISPEALFTAWEAAKKELPNGGGFPCIDGKLVVGKGPELLQQGKQHPIAYMAGSTSEDMIPPILQSMSRKWCAAQPVPSYCWFFNRKLPGDDNGAWHSSDLWYWFGTLENSWRPMERKDFALSEEMVSYLCNFARTGNPNQSGVLPTWIASDVPQKRVLWLGEKPTHMAKTKALPLFVTMLKKRSTGE